LIPNIVRINPTRPINIWTAPDEGSIFLRIFHAACLGWFDEGLARELVVDVVDVVDGEVGPGGAGAAVVAAEEGPEAGFDMIICRSMRQSAIRCSQIEWKRKSLGQVLCESVF